MAARTCGKSATNGLPTLVESEEMLFRAGPNPGKQDGFIRKTQASGERFGDEGGLIVAALALAAAMQRDGHDHVGFEGRAAEDGHSREHAGEQFTERLDIFKFQEEDGLDHGAIVEGPRPHVIERQSAMLWIGAAGAGKDAVIFGGGIFDWGSAMVTNGSSDLLERTEAFVADGNAGGFGEHAVADAAAGRKKYAEESGADVVRPASRRLEADR